MQWNRKWIGICAAVFVLLAGILAVEGWHRPEKTNTQRATEEEWVAPATKEAVSVSGTSLSQETKAPGKSHPLATANAKGKTEQTKAPKETASNPAPAAKTKGQKKKTEIEKKKNDKKKDSSAKASKTPVPARTAAPTTEPAGETERKVEFRIDCTAILDKRDLWKDGIEEVIPKSGVFYSGTVSFQTGDTVYDILKKICADNGIALDSQYTPLYETYYVRGIGNLYEFDCGSESGWKYSVNGILPGVGSSGYTVKNGDKVVFFYDYQY